MVTDTKPLEKCCSRCGETKTEDMFIPKRNICKICRNERSREKYKSLEISEECHAECNVCNEHKPVVDFIKNRKICKSCNNDNRKTKYHTDYEHRLTLIKKASEFKHNKVIENQQVKESEKKKKEEEIGQENNICKYCQSIQPKTRFRFNRLKCKNCERDDPIEKFKRNVRGRIIDCLKKKNKNKEKHTIEYLGCTSSDYLQWLLYNKNDYVLENRGKIWHIDHVIPLSKFTLETLEEQLVAFNWRNTMPLSVKENLSKNNKILKPQIEQHWKNLLEYHQKYKIEMPQTIIDLFAKHLDDGDCPKLSLPLTVGNLCEELG
jgi:hypothetical protein